MISVILPVLNGADTIGAAIKSVLGQSFTRCELIVLDGGSRDGTLAVLRSLGGRIDYWESARDRGIYDAMNRGVDLARGKWLYFMGADDTLHDGEAFADLMAPASIEASEDLIAGEVIQAGGRRFRSRFGACLLLKNTVHHQAALYHRRVFDSFRYGRRAGGGIRPYRISGDYQLNLRLYREGRRARVTRRAVARCAGGASEEGRWLGYLEEILVRHGELSFWQALPFDYQTLARYLVKQVTRRVRGRVRLLQGAGKSG